MYVNYFESGSVVLLDIFINIPIMHSKNATWKT